MIWHVVRLDLSGLDPGTRGDLEEALAGLAELDEVAWLRVGRDLDDPGVTGLLTAFESAADLAAYRVHPRHVPVFRRLRELDVPVVRLDLATDDAAHDLPRG